MVSLKGLSLNISMRPELGDDGLCHRRGGRRMEILSV